MRESKAFVGRQKFWDERYAKGDKKPIADPFLTENRHLLPSRGRALDVACGLGGNALFLAKVGLQVEGWDFSSKAIAQLQQEAQQQEVVLSAEVRDVVEQPWPKKRYDLITVSRFLDRSLTLSMVEALKPGGLLFYQTFVQWKVGERGPKDLAYRLGKNELLTLFVPALSLVFYREEWDVGVGASDRRDSAFLIGRVPSQSWSINHPA
ncbi:MAG: class I SAM-dependent methyltransferase [Magnetococcales bacterium]|nr:class I SAM-dependent methyltransferase [Magnetococcales bacterium]